MYKQYRLLSLLNEGKMDVRTFIMPWHITLGLAETAGDSEPAAYIVARWAVGLTRWRTVDIGWTKGGLTRLGQFILPGNMLIVAVSKPAACQIGFFHYFSRFFSQAQPFVKGTQLLNLQSK